jgi:hypothetical protein
MDMPGAGGGPIGPIGGMFQTAGGGIGAMGGIGGIDICAEFCRNAGAK